MQVMKRGIAAVAVSAIALALSSFAPTSLPSASAVAAKSAACDPHDHSRSGSDARVSADAYQAGVRESYDDAAYARAVARGEGKRAPSATRTGPIQIRVYAHIIQDTATVGAMTDAEIAGQIDDLNEAYAGVYNGTTGNTNTTISFVLAGTTRTINSAWYPLDYGSSQETAMKTALRQGGKRDLNMYFNDLTDDLLGWATFPDEYAGAPEMDGVVNLNESVRGGSASPYNLGATAIHEVGHWLGLFHTFEDFFGNPCNPAFGDLVADTAPEATATSGCPAGKDTCPAAGVDPITNFMDYSFDACMDEFTPGQVTRVDAQTKQYRNTGAAPASTALTTVTATPVSVTVVDPERDTFSMTNTTPTHGDVTRSGKTLTYTPDAGYTGPDSFLVSTTDVMGTTRNSTVSVTVTSSVGTSLTGVHQPEPSVFGSASALKVTVAPTTGSTTPTGTVTVKEGANTVGTATLAGGTGSVTLPGSLSVGAHTFALTYSGDGGHEPSTATASATVNAVGTTVTGVHQPEPSVFGSASALKVTVAPTSGGTTPTGTVTVKEGGSTVGTATLAAGTGTVALPGSLSVGTHTFALTYSGDGSRAPSSGTASATVESPPLPPPTASTTAADAPKKVKKGKKVKVDVSVTAGGPATGSVTISENGKVLGTGTLAGGVVRINVGKLELGKHTLTVTYGGSPTATASSTTVKVKVKKKTKKN